MRRRLLLLYTSCVAIDEVLLIGGPVGVGRSTVSWEVSVQLSQLRIAHWHLEGDVLDAAWHRPEDTETASELRSTQCAHHTMAALAGRPANPRASQRAEFGRPGGMPGDRLVRTAAASDEPRDTGPVSNSERIHGWVEVEIADVVVERLGEGNVGVIAEGYRESKDRRTAVLVAVDALGQVEIHDAPVAGPIHSVRPCDTGQVLLAVGETSPSLLLWPRFAEREGFALVDEKFATESATQLWLTSGEDMFYITEWADGRLTAAEPHMQELYPEGDGRRGAGSNDPIVGSGQGIAFVAGELARPGAQARPSLWSINGEGCEPEGEWQEVHLDPRPDAVTDFSEGYGVGMAGHLNGRPMWFDDIGQPREAPTVELDPDYPQVLIVDGGSLALQSRTQGPQLWTHEVRILGPFGNYLLGDSTPRASFAAGCCLQVPVAGDQRAAVAPDAGVNDKRRLDALPAAVGYDDSDKERQRQVGSEASQVKDGTRRDSFAGHGGAPASNVVRLGEG